MVVMWMVKHGVPRIERRECTRVTKTSVWFMKSQILILPGGATSIQVEVKASRQTSQAGYHPTWEEAHSQMLEYASLELQWKRRQLEIANSYYGNVKGLKKPAEAN